MNKPSPTLRIPINPQPHNTLSTFLKHASQTSLSKTSTTYLGTRYEYLVQSHLSSKLSFSLTRTGGRGDFGIDLLGTWDLPNVIARQRSTSSSPSPSSSSSTPPPIKVLIQCKRIRSRPSPNLIRELEGSTRGAPYSFRDNASPSSSSTSSASSSSGEDQETPTKTLSILVCSQPATKGVREAMSKSPRGLMFAFIEEVAVSVPVPLSDSIPGINLASELKSKPNSESSMKSEDAEDDETDLERTNSNANSEVENEDKDKDEDIDIKMEIPQTRMRQLLWNRAAAVYCGLEGLDVGTRYVDGENVSGTKDKEVILLWKGRPLDFELKS